MKILLTGANGQLGTRVQALLTDGGCALGSIPAIFTDCTLLCVGHDTLDIADAAAVQTYLQEQRPELVINCAAMTNVDACETNSEAAMRVNALGPQNLALACAKIGAKLVHISTDYVFAGDGTAPYTEWDSCAPQTVYGKSKLLGEQYVRESGCCYFIIRTAWLYGDTGANFVKTILKAARERGILNVVDDQRGNPTNAVDLAYHILKVADGGQQGIYHITGNGECSWYDFACEIVRLSGIPCTVTPCTTAEFPRPAKRPTYSALDHLMLRCTVGDEMRPWRQALAEFMEKYRG